MEEERSGASARAAREKAKRDRDREARERLRQQQSEQQAAELLALRERAQVEDAQRTELAARLVEEAARRRALEAQLERLSVQHHDVAGGHAPSAPPRKHLALWSAALLGAGAFFFWLTPRQAASPSPVVAESAPVAIEAAAIHCPELAPVDPLPPPRRSLTEQVPAAAATAPRGPRRTGEKRPPRAVQSTSSLPVDCAGKGPLCGMPED